LTIQLLRSKQFLGNLLKYTQINPPLIYFREIADLRAQVDSEREIRSIMEGLNKEMKEELSKLKKRLEDATTQKQEIVAEKNGTFPLSPSRLWLPKGRAREKIATKLNKPINL